MNMKAKLKKKIKANGANPNDTDLKEVARMGEVVSEARGACPEFR